MNMSDVVKKAYERRYSGQSTPQLDQMSPMQPATTPPVQAPSMPSPQGSALPPMQPTKEKEMKAPRDAMGEERLMLTKALTKQLNVLTKAGTGVGTSQGV
jgi:hypothetical protein